LCDLDDAVARFAFRELPCHLAVGATEPSGRAHHGLCRLTPGAGDRNPELGGVRGTGRPALLLTGSALRVATAWAPKVHVIPSSPCIVTECLPRTVDSERLLRGFGQHLVGSAAVLVRMEKENFDAPRVSDRVAIRGWINPEDVVMVQRMSPCDVEISGGGFGVRVGTALPGTVEGVCVGYARSAQVAFCWTYHPTKERIATSVGMLTRRASAMKSEGLARVGLTRTERGIPSPLIGGRKRETTSGRDRTRHDSSVADTFRVGSLTDTVPCLSGTWFETSHSSGGATAELERARPLGWTLHETFGSGRSTRREHVRQRGLGSGT
jgi:hypothetical protein